MNETNKVPTKDEVLSVVRRNTGITIEGFYPMGYVNIMTQLRDLIKEEKIFMDSDKEIMRFYPND